MGDATFQIAKENPNKNYLCIEVFKAGIASLLGKIESESLKNIRIIEGDAIKILERMIMVHSIFFSLTHGKKRNIIKDVLLDDLELICCKVNW